MIAYDYLIMQMGESEIRSHKGALEPDIVNNEKRTRSFSSIFECKLPDFLFENDYMGLKNAFYGIYLYMLKVYLLYSDKRIEPIEKIKSLSPSDHERQEKRWGGEAESSFVSWIPQ